MSGPIQFGIPYPLNDYRVRLDNNRTISLFQCMGTEVYQHDLVDNGAIRIEIISTDLIFSAVSSVIAPVHLATARHTSDILDAVSGDPDINLVSSGISANHSALSPGTAAVVNGIGHLAAIGVAPEVDEIALINDNGVQFLNETNGLILVGTDDLRYECLQRPVRSQYWFDCRLGPVDLAWSSNMSGNDVIRISSARGTGRLFRMFFYTGD